MLRRHGSTVDSAVLVGIEGPDHTLKLPSNYDAHLARLSQLIKQDPRMGEEMPDFSRAVREALARLEKESLTVTVTDPVSREPADFRVGPWGFAYILVRDLGDTTDLPVLPRLVDEVRRGEGKLLSWFVQKRLTGFAVLNVAYFLVDPSSGVSDDRAKRIEVEARTAILGNAMNFTFPGADRAFRPTILGDDFRAPLSCDVKTLFVSGDLDSNTPPSQADEVRAGFSRGKSLLMVNGGHEDWMRSPDVVQALLAYLRDGDPGSERIQLPPVRFAPLRGRAPGFNHPSLGQ